MARELRASATRVLAVVDDLEIQVADQSGELQHSPRMNADDERQAGLELLGPAMARDQRSDTAGVEECHRSQIHDDLCAAAVQTLEHGCLQLAGGSDIHLTGRPDDREFTIPAGLEAEVGKLHRQLRGQQPLEERSVALQRDSKVFGGYVLAAIPLGLEPFALLGEALGQPLH